MRNPRSTSTIKIEEGQSRSRGGYEISRPVQPATTDNAAYCNLFSAAIEQKKSRLIYDFPQSSSAIPTKRETLDQNTASSTFVGNETPTTKALEK